MAHEGLHEDASKVNADTIERLYRGDMTHLAPYPCGDAAIFNARGEILLIQRKDDQLWAMPGGGFEVGETPAAAAFVRRVHRRSPGCA